MKIRRIFTIAALGLCCCVNAQDDVLADALFSQGEMRLQQAKTDDDYKAVFDLMKKAADSGSQKAYLYLGILHFEGKGTAKNTKKAIEFWGLADKKSPRYPTGIAEAKYYLGLELFQRQTRSNDDNSRMKDLLETAGTMGSPEAFGCLGKLYWNGNEFYTKDLNSSKGYFLKAELIKPDAEYEYYLGCYFLIQDHNRKRDKDSAIYWLTLSANKEYLPAHAKLGLFYLDEKNFEKADFHLTKAIPLKNLEAITALNAFRVFRHEKSNDGNLSENAKKIVRSWLTRARSGDKVAALTLGRYFLLRATNQSGIVFCNAGQGFYFLQYAAALGSKEAQDLTGSLSLKDLKEQDNPVVKWHKLSGEEVVKNINEVYRVYSTEITDPEYASGFFREIQNMMTPIGIYWIQDHTTVGIYEKDKLFSSVGIRISPEKKIEYYVMKMNDDRDFQVKFLGNNVTLLHAWIDAGYIMTATKNEEGKIVVSGMAIDSTTGTYPGNDDPKDNYYGKYGRAGFNEADHSAVEAFFPNLKKLLKENKREEIANLIQYPFILNEETPLQETVKDKQDFLLRFDEIFTESFKQELFNTPDDEIFSTWMGVVAGKNLIYFVPGKNEQAGKIFISKIGAHCFLMPEIFIETKKQEKDSEITVNNASQQPQEEKK